MKTLRLAVLWLLATAAICQAQFTSPGWYRATNQSLSVQTRDSFTPPDFEPDYTPPSPQPSVPVAEVITPQIQALADGLQDNPELIFNYVHDHIRFVLYFGSKKGAELTLLEKSGNDFDQSALLMALLTAAGYTNVQYQFGWQQIPYDDPYGYDYDLHHWWQLTLTNTSNTWDTVTVPYLYDLIGVRGYPLAYYFDDGNTFEIQRTWVALTVGTNTYQLDPAFKVSEPVSSVPLTNALGAIGTTVSNALLTAAAGTDTGNYTQSLNEANVRGQLTTYTSNLLNYIQTNSPNASVQDILGGWQITPAYDPFDYSIYTEFPTDDFGGQMPILSWTYEPTNMMSTLQITFAGTNYQWFMPQLQGQRLSLVFSNNGVAQLFQEDTLLAQHATSGSGTTNVILYAHHPDGLWNTTNNTFINEDYADQTTTNAYQCTNAIYALLYAFEPDWGWLQQRQNKLDTYLQEGFTNGSVQVTSESLNVMGLNWMLQTAQMEGMLGTQEGILPQYFHRLGRMAQETGKGYYVDVYMQLTGEYPSGGDDAAHIQISNTHFDLFSFFASSFENGIIEQLQNTNLVGASTVKMLEIANTNGQAVYLASSTNWTAGYNVQSHLANYSAATLNQIYSNYINQGYYVLMPQNGSNHVSSVTGSWAGYGYEARQAVNGVAANSLMIIAGGYNGGYSSDPDVPVDPIYIDTTSDSQPTYYDTTPVSTPAPTGADPVDLANGTFLVENTDLALGQAEPRGISLSRYYNGTRRFSNPAGMAAGWTHNYSVNANNIAAPQACLGGTTPAQAASMLAATASAIAIYNGGLPDPKNWLTTALIAKWGVDQVTKSGVSISLGKYTMQFVQQPNGVFTPPANCTATLAQSGSLYNLSQRHGNTYNFDSLGRLTNIVDQYANSLLLTYNASNWVSTVKDWKSRTFTFNYTGTPSRLTSVTDGTRTVNYGYSTTYNSQGDLTSFTDPESKTSTYAYDTNHQIIATVNALTQLVVTNIYDTQGHIKTQYTQGNTNKSWQIYWSGWETSQFDPAGGETDYYYDDMGRLTAVVDPLDNETDTYYDGQNHVTFTVSPLNEIKQFVYDGNNNLIQTVDALNCTNQFIYDTQNDLISSIDARTNTSKFGYNAQFSLTGSTNGAGDYVTYTYNSDGTLASRTDSGGTTTYGYDSTYRQLITITYPGSLGAESFANSLFGDVTNHTDGRGFSTAFQYNLRRQLTNSIGPTNVVAQISYDAAGNTLTMTDARGNVTSNLWNASHDLLAKTMPPTPQGTAVVSNIYDNRDWLVTSIDPLQKPTQYTNDASGRLIATTDPLSRTSHFGYDADGHKIAITNGFGETTHQQWDARSELTKLTDGAGNAVLYSFDAAGNEITLTNRNSKGWHFYFDGANRLTNTSTPLGRTNIKTFNHQGLVATLKDPSGQTTTYTYDGKRRLTSRADNLATTTYNYDASDNLTNAYENGLTNAWALDAYSHVSNYKDAYGNQIQFHYDSGGNLTNLIYPGGKNVYYAYDSLNRLTNVMDWSGRKTTIAYDLSGRLTSIIRPNGTYRTVSYDAAGEVTNILEQTPIGFPINLFELGWDAAARVRSEFAAPLPHTNRPAGRTNTYDSDNRLATVDGNAVTMDTNGNLISGPLTNDTFFTYTYDPRNRLVNVGGVTNIYDPAGNRIGIDYGTNSESYVVNPNTKWPQVLMRVKNGTTNYYIYGMGLMYQIVEGATVTNTLTYHYDYRGSTVALSDNNGNVTDRIEYSAYGTTTYRVGTNDTPFLFNGRFGVMTDPNGLLYMRSRHYNPFLCRFISADPSGFAGGLNFYAYANGNPINYLDPFGLGVWTSVFGGLRAVGGGVEALAGFTFAVVTSETVVGAVAGTAVGIHGIDSFQAGIRQMISGDQVDSVTSTGLQAAGVPQTYANLADAGISIVGTAGTSLVGSAPATGSLVHLTDSAGGAGINASGTLIGDSGIYAGPLENAADSGIGITLRTGLSPSSYEAAVPIPEIAEGAFSSVTPIGPFSGWQSAFGQVYTQGGTLDLATGVFTQTGLNWGQAAFYGLDATIVNGGAFTGTLATSPSTSASTGK